jgi:CRP/FNR family transcriptional regulator, cyclic AMP receptor protein
MDPDPKLRPDPGQLAAVPLFESLSPEQLQAIAGLTSLRRAESGRRLVGQGTPGYSFFVLQKGTVSVTSGGAEIEDLGPGDFFGEMALLGEGERTATVTTTSPVMMLVMLGHDFRIFTRDFPEVAARLRQAMTERFERSRKTGND